MTAVLFVLLPHRDRMQELFDGCPRPLRVVSYGPADDARHLASLIRARRDHTATRWLRGLLLCIGGGALLGLSVNGILAGVFGMLGGLLQIALPLGFVLGAFLGGFTAAMTGTEVARDEVRRLLPHAARGAILLQVHVTDDVALAALRERCARLQLPSARRE